MKLVKLALAVTALSLSACTTIHFENGKQAVSKKTSEKWHHNFALALYEQSAPVDLNKECDGKTWTKVTTKQTALNGLAGGVANNLGPIWYPKTVEISCGEKSE